MAENNKHFVNKLNSNQLIMSARKSAKNKKEANEKDDKKKRAKTSALKRRLESSK